MPKVPESIRELQPHAIWYVIERVFIASLIGRGGGEMLHVNPIDLGLLALGLILFARPLFTRKQSGPNVETRIETLTQNWVDEVEARSNLGREMTTAIANARHWTDTVNGKVGDLTETVKILADDYRKRNQNT